VKTSDSYVNSSLNLKLELYYRIDGHLPQTKQESKFIFGLITDNKIKYDMAITKFYVNILFNFTHGCNRFVLMPRVVFRVKTSGGEISW
jgi:hypothetical protein